MLPLLRVAEVGRPSAKKNALNSFVGSVFAGSRQTNYVLTCAYYQNMDVSFNSGLFCLNLDKRNKIAHVRASNFRLSPNFSINAVCAISANLPLLIKSKVDMMDRIYHPFSVTIIVTSCVPHNHRCHLFGLDVNIIWKRTSQIWNGQAQSCKFSGEQNHLRMNIAPMFNHSS